jgi:hypothetical protein
MMGLVDNDFIGVGVNHGRGDGLVAQHLLEDGGWYTGLGRVPAKNMPPSVGIELLVMQGSAFGGAMEDLALAWLLLFIYGLNTSSGMVVYQRWVQREVPAGDYPRPTAHPCTIWATRWHKLAIPISFYLTR